MSAGLREKLKTLAPLLHSLAKMSKLRGITTFDKCDFYIGKNEIERLGYESNTSMGHMIDLALEHKCRVIIKNGVNGKFYLKCKDMSYNDVLTLAQAKEGKMRDGVLCYVLNTID